MRILFIGCGNMGGAILSGMLASKFCTSQQVDVITNTAENIPLLWKKWGVQATLQQQHTNYDAVIFAIKPQDMHVALEPCNFDFTTLLISVMAGKSYAQLKGLYPQHKIIRAMPNIPAVVKKGVTLAYTEDSLHLKERTLFDGIFMGCGSVYFIEQESALELATLISGCGPAYYFLFTEMLAEAVIKMGLDRNIATQIAIETMIGAAYLAQDSNFTLLEQQTRIASRGGITEAVLENLRQDLPALLAKGLAAGVKRTEELRD